jgi:hypothetical protein
VNGDRRGDYYLATFDALAPSAFATATWPDLDGETYGECSTQSSDPTRA